MRAFAVGVGLGAGAHYVFGVSEVVMVTGALVAVIAVEVLS